MNDDGKTMFEDDVPSKAQIEEEILRCSKIRKGDII
jgi:hypothetical protein